MRGQRLFVRKIENADRDAIRRFLEHQCDRTDIPAHGLLGKLAGDLVAVLAMQITPDAVEITDIVVAKDLRRKRIGRILVTEVEQMASTIERRKLIVEGQSEAPEFLRKVGFEQEGSRWVRRI
jgi:N-acetylglutamate synthase-like GNAT family acetyltransferase